MIKKNELHVEADVGTTVYLPKQLHRQLRLFALEVGVSASEVVREAVRQYMAQRANGRAGAKEQAPSSP